MDDNSAMPRYSFTLENGARVADPEATEDLPNDKMAIESAKLLARDFAKSLAAQGNLRVVVRDQAGKEIGDVPLLAERR